MCARRVLVGLLLVCLVGFGQIWGATIRNATEEKVRGGFLNKNGVGVEGFIAVGCARVLTLFNNFQDKNMNISFFKSNKTFLDLLQRQ